MCELAPSIFAANYLELKNQIETIEKAGAKYLHIDIMDGHFVPNLSFGPGLVASLRSYTDLILDVHLMLKTPGKFIQSFSEAGADIITVHVEVKDDTAGLLDLIHEQGKRAGVVIKPETQIEAIDKKIWERIDVIQIMTVEPGLSGQKFIPSSYKKIGKTREKITELQKRNPERKIDLEVDGDITSCNLEKVISAGANIVVAGKGVFSGCLSDNLRTYMEILKSGGEDALHNRN